MGEWLSKRAICELAELPSTTLQRWCEQGLVIPEGRGTRESYQFTVMQAVGLVVGARLQRTERGCALSYVGRVVEAFGQMSEVDLLSEFERGNTHLVAIIQGKPVLRGPEYDRVSVKDAHREVRAYLAKRDGPPATTPTANLSE